jgi:UDPglucose--hexose-1-phosphate uridylyltransferase
LRTVDLTLGGEKWFWQYSPYGYFNEHGIAVNCKHTPMHIDRTTFEKLLDFVDLFPHYFIGCNAPLPRIGGSVLAHDHFQGGGEILPMHRAGAAYCLKHPHFDDASIQVVDWFGTVVRIVSPNRQSIVALSELVRQGWIGYQNEGLGIIAKDCDGVHSAISPTVLKTDRGYEMSIILRNNITSEQYPDGVFHAHPQYHAIKKESIGLIEAQGLFILPGRLEGELEQVETFIKNNRPLRDEYKQFAIVYDGAKARGGDVHKAVQRQLGVICTQILQNTAVFKDKKQTVEFLNSLGIK